MNPQAAAPAATTTSAPVVAPVTTPTAVAPTTTTSTATPSTQDTVAQSLGYKSYDDAVKTLTAAPTEGETQLYNDAYSAAGLDTLANTITGKQNELVTAQGNINDNPWLDEADRVGRNKVVTDMATADIKNYQNEYNTKLKEVQDLVTREGADNTATSASNKAKLAALEAQAKSAAAAATAAQKASTTAPKTVKAASGATYQWNPTTNSFTQLFAGKTATGTSATKDSIASMANELQAKVTSSNEDGSPYSRDGFITPQDWDTALKAWNSQGLSTASFVSNFKQYANSADTGDNYTGLTKAK